MVTVDFPAWHANAKCRTAEPGSYDFPDHTPRGHERDEWNRYLVEACGDCPVLRECAADALELTRLTVHVIRAGACNTGATESRAKARRHWRKVVATGGLG